MNILFTSLMAGAILSGTVLFIAAYIRSASLMNRAMVVLGFSASFYALFDVLTIIFGFIFKQYQLARFFNLWEQVFVALSIPALPMVFHGLDRQHLLSRRLYRYLERICWLFFIFFVTAAVFFPGLVKSLYVPAINEDLWIMEGRGEGGFLYNLRDFILVLEMVFFGIGLVFLYRKNRYWGDWAFHVIASVTAISLGTLDILNNYFGWRLSETMPLTPGILGLTLFVGMVMMGVVIDYSKNQKALTKAHQDLKDTNEMLEFLALNDPLTKLPNRASYEVKIQDSLSLAERNQSRFALIHLNMDNFRSINDTYGSYRGDRLLVAAGERIRSHLRESDQLFRIMGDEFAIILDNLDHPTTVAIVAQKILDAFLPPVLVSGESHFLGASMGIVIYPDDSLSREDLLRMVNQALLEAKKDKQTFRFYAQELDQESHKRISILHDLRLAMKRQSLEMYYQPICSPEGKVVGAEALLRWERSAGEFISPQIFVPLAETTGLIKPLGEWVLRESLEKWAPVYKEFPDLFLSINLSAKQLRDQQLPDIIQKLLNLYKIPKEAIHLEITETALMETRKGSNSVLHGLQKANYGLAIDDFGVGYSSLAYLRSLPVEILKIDKSFIQNASLAQKDLTILKSIFDLAVGIGLRVIAEGVETKEQVDFLAGMGCGYLQGFYFSKALSLSDYLNFIRVRNQVL